MKGLVEKGMQFRDAPTLVTRGVGTKSLKVEALTENANLFLAQIGDILDKAPEEVGKFKFTEFIVTAEISAKGVLVLMGTGVETEAKGGLAFKFERK